jgi:hypothetical protein
MVVPKLECLAESTDRSIFVFVFRFVKWTDAGRLLQRKPNGSGTIFFLCHTVVSGHAINGTGDSGREPFSLLLCCLARTLGFESGIRKSPQMVSIHEVQAVQFTRINSRGTSGRFGTRACMPLNTLLRIRLGKLLSAPP